MREVKFSIIIPVYNVEKYLNKCVDSVLLQNYENIEIILVDDGSTDKSGSICDKYAMKDSRIKVIHKKNAGLLLARRSGIGIATGDFIVHLDSDDYWEPGLLINANRVIENNNCDMIIFNYNNVYPDKTEKETDLFENESVFSGEDKKKLYKLAIESNCINHLVRKIVSRNIVDIDGDYSVFSDITFGEDVLQSIPLLIKAKKIVYMADAYYNYRRHTGMTSCFTHKWLCSTYRVRWEMVRLYSNTEFDLENSINSMIFKSIDNLWKYIVLTYMYDKDNFRYACIYVFESDIYIKSKKMYWSKLSWFKKIFLKCVENERILLVRVIVYILKIKNKLVGK